MWVAFGVGAVAVLAITGLAGMIAVGTSEPPPYLASIGEPFRKIDFRDLPPLQTTLARDGTPIAFRVWQPLTPAVPGRIVIAIYGSSASSTSLHALNAEGLTVYAPDMRDHGGIGRRGDLD